MTKIRLAAIAVSQSGTAVMALTVVGPDYYPSAGYVVLDRNGKPGPVRIAAAGLVPQDGFSYNAFSFGGLFPRWGAAAAVDGNTVWIASEDIGQTCTLAAFEAAPFGRCAGTRGVLGNWCTRISAIQPQPPARSPARFLTEGHFQGIKSPSRSTGSGTRRHWVAVGSLGV